MTVRTEQARSTVEVPMISGLLRKDLAVFIPRDRLFMVLVYLLAHPMVLPSQEAFFWLGIALAGALSLYVPIIEWHQETDRMLSSLPVGRSAIVTARYVSALIGCGIALVAWASTGRLLAPVLAPLLATGAETPGMWMSLEGLLAFSITAGLLISLFLPLYFRFGMGRGALAFAGLSVLLLLASAPLMGLTGSGKAPLSPGTTPFAGILPPGAVIRIKMEALTSSIGPGWALFAILGGMALALAFSSRLSVRWFRRRDL